MSFSFTWFVVLIFLQTSIQFQLLLKVKVSNSLVELCISLQFGQFLLPVLWVSVMRCIFVQNCYGHPSLSLVINFHITSIFFRCWYNHFSSLLVSVFIVCLFTFFYLPVFIDLCFCHCEVSFFVSSNIFLILTSVGIPW